MWNDIRKGFRSSLTAFAGAALLAVGLGVIAPESAQAATLYISEFSTGVTNAPGSDQAQIPPQAALADQAVALSGSSALSSAFNTKTHAVMLMCDEGCSIAFGSSSATATTSNFLLQQGVPYVYGAAPGQFVAAIANSAGNTGGGSGGPSANVNVAQWGGTATTLGQKAMAASVPVTWASDQSALPAGTNYIGFSSPRIATISTTITRPNDSTAYAANDAFSDSTSAPTTGGFTLTSACSASGGNGTIQSAVLSSSAGTAYNGEIWVFDQAVTNINDNSAFTITDGEAQTLVGVIPFNTTDVTAANAVSYVTGLNIGYTCIGTANLRFLVKIMAAVTPAAQEVLSVRVQVQN